METTDQHQIKGEEETSPRLSYHFHFLLRAVGEPHDSVNQKGVIEVYDFRHEPLPFIANPEWLLEHRQPEWADRYGVRMEDSRLPSGEEER